MFERLRISTTFTVIILMVVFGKNVYSEECSQILKQSLSKVEKIKDYSAIVETFNKKGKLEETTVYDYKYLSPGYIRMKVIEGRKKGGEVFFDPKAYKVKGCKSVVFKFCKEFNPDDNDIRSIRGVRVFETSLVNILKDTEKNLSKGVCSVKTEGAFDVLEINLGEKDKDVDRIVLKIGKKDFIPYVWEKYGNNQLLYRLSIKNLKTNIGLKLEELAL